MAIEPILPVAIPHTDARLARGMRAGRWLFATGQSGTDYVNGIAPEVDAGGSSAQRRAALQARGAAAVPQCRGSAGAGRRRLSRRGADRSVLHQRAAVDPYHEVRREVFKGRIPPSTSNLHQRLALSGQSIEAHVMAAVPGASFKAEHQSFTPSYKIHHSSGYSPGLSAGDFRFIPGQTAETRVEGEGPIDVEARRPVGLWKGHRDQARDRLHHQAQDGALARSSRREPRHRGQRRKSFCATATTCPPSTRSGAHIFRWIRRRPPSSRPRRRASSCRSRASRLM